MQLADQYAKALHELAAKNPAGFSAYVKNMRAALQKRGHEKLLPRILKAYENLDASNGRQARLRAITPQMRRTRTLVELYKKLIMS